jgi:hypothetical protein
VPPNQSFVANRFYGRGKAIGATMASTGGGTCE